MARTEEETIEFPITLLERQVEKLQVVYSSLSDMAAKERDSARAREFHRLAHDVNHVVAVVGNEILLIRRRAGRS